MKRIRKMGILGLCLVFIGVVASTIYVNAYVQQRAMCNRCKRYNYSYGCNPNARTISSKANSGEYCEGCHSYVESGKYHTYIISSDKYYFRCDSNRCKRLNFNDRIYTKFLNDRTIEHNIYNNK